MNKPQYTDKEADFARQLGTRFAEASWDQAHGVALETMHKVVQKNVSPDLMIEHYAPAFLNTLGKLAASSALSGAVSEELSFKIEQDYDSHLAKFRAKFIEAFSDGFDQSARKLLPKLDAVKQILAP